MRLVAELLRTTFVVVDTVVHLPNTPTLRETVRLDRQTFLDDWIGNEMLKSDSTVSLSDELNAASKTEDGKYLVIEFNLGFVRLIERVNIIIKASQTSTDVTIG